MREFVVYNQGGSLTLKHYVSQSQVVPTSCTVSIYNGSGGVIIEDATGSISASGTMTYVLSATQCSTEGENWRCEWVFVYDSETYNRITYFDVIEGGGFYCTFGKNDLLRHDPTLATKCSDSEIDSYCHGVYQELISDILQQGWTLNKIKNPEYFTMAGVYKCLGNIYFNFSKHSEDVFGYKAAEYLSRYDKTMNKIFFFIDKNRDEVLSSTEASSFEGITLSRRGYDF